MGSRQHRQGLCLAACALAFGAMLPAQHGEAASNHQGTEDNRAVDANGGAHRATHAPQPTLPPLLALQHVKLGNEAFTQNQQTHAPHAQLRPRPAGAGRYVCAVITCADADLDVAAPLGLTRRDVLVLRVPGPFVTPETVALLDRVITAERLSLVVLLGHEHCRTLAANDDGQAGPQLPQADVLTRRVAALAAAPRLPGQTLHDVLLQRQRELLLASSKLITGKVEQDELRIVAGLIDDRTGAIEWRHPRTADLPLAPVK